MIKKYVLSVEINVTNSSDLSDKYARRVLDDMSPMFTELIVDTGMDFVKGYIGDTREIGLQAFVTVTDFQDKL